jgi:hypothetical protein
MILTRRALVSTSFLIPLGLVTACATGQPLTPALIVSEAQAIAQGLSGALTQVPAGLIPAATIATLQNDLTLAEAAAASLTANLPAATGATTVAKINSWINAVFDTLAAPPLNGVIPAPFNTAISYATIVLPALEGFVDQFIVAPPATAGVSLAGVALRAKSIPAGVSVAQAVSGLQGFAK